MKPTQATLDEIQATYRQWRELYTQAQTSLETLQQLSERMAVLDNFYFEGAYREFVDAMDEGEHFDTTTKGEYSVLGEDTLWDAHHDYKQLLWQQLKLLVDLLDEKQQP